MNYRKLTNRRIDHQRFNHHERTSRKTANKLSKSLYSSSRREIIKS